MKKINFKSLIFKQNKFYRILLGPKRGLLFNIVGESNYSVLFNRWEPGITKLLSKKIKSGSSVIDIGCNVGIHSLLFSKMVGDLGHVFCVDALPQNCIVTESNLKINNIKNCSVFNYAICDTDYGQVEFNLGKNDKWGSLIKSGHITSDSLKITAITIDTFIRKFGITPNLVKIDIEDAEKMAMPYFSSTLEEFRPSVLIESHSAESAVIILELFKKLDYSFYIVNETNGDLLARDYSTYDVGSGCFSAFFENN
jgi:FkbM family methyltransferase